MRFLAALLILFCVGLGLLLFIPMLSVGLVLVTPLGWLLIWFLPILIIACSEKTTGVEKLAWILAIIFLSWFAWVFYFLVAPIKEKPEYRSSPRHQAYRYY